MRKQSNKTLFMVVIIVLCIATLVINHYKNLLVTNSYKLEIPSNCKAAVVFSTGRNQAERSQIQFFDKNGDVISRQLFSSASSRWALEGYENNYNFFTNEIVYFNNGHTLYNKEMEDIYSFASDNGEDKVCYSGYIKNWGMYYKSIPHGMAYDISDLGFFDILSLYNENEIINIRTSNLPIVTVKEDENDTAVYCFSDHTENLEETDLDAIFYEKIICDGSEFKKENGKIDISKADYKKTCSVTNAVWCGNDLYMMVNQDEDSLHRYMYHILKEGDDLRFISSVHLDWKQIGLREAGYDVYTQTIPFLRGGVIEYHQYCSANTAPGVVCYDIKRETFSFIKYDHYDEGADGEYRTINGTLYYLEQDEMDRSKYNIYNVNKINNYNRIITIKPTAKSMSNMFLVDFYIFD